MRVFIVESVLPEMTPEIMVAIPGHRKVINRLFNEGKIVAYAVNDTKSKLWCHIKAMDEYEVMDILQQMPLISVLRPVIHSTVIYDGVEDLVPRFSLN